MKYKLRKNWLSIGVSLLVQKGEIIVCMRTIKLSLGPVCRLKYDLKMFSKIHVLILFVLGSAGCMLRAETVKDRFAGEFRCARDRISVERPDKNRPEFYRATGCNRRASYQCSGDYGEFCERLGQPETINPEAGALPTIPSPEKPADPVPQPPKDNPTSSPPAP